ncbi:hypothetical protein GN958_ATG15457 [Phytophthora infestans]|uniref:DDE-1 domain-containing protein n=1 Tax=Phytophthora infestans TaxID=4787 RepID=A0A8S9TWI6_PHYIN|nr:hypothetical protein GN958_ATG18009 [Phytophthora infestans]KAF4135335.1 hypothetical protein GN958_ATG15457 [Phytophthora infestans]
MRNQNKQQRVVDKTGKPKRPDRAMVCNWVQQAWDDLPSETIANGFRASGLLPSENCIAAAELISELENLKLLEGRPVDTSQDFMLDDVVDEAIVQSNI